MTPAEWIFLSLLVIDLILFGADLILHYREHLRKQDRELDRALFRASDNPEDLFPIHYESPVIERNRIFADADEERQWIHDGFKTPIELDYEIRKELEGKDEREE